MGERARDVACHRTLGGFAEGRRALAPAGRACEDRAAMTRWFNVAGPCVATRHYMIPAARRAVEAEKLIDEGRWFSLVSGRQTGKTTVG